MCSWIILKMVSVNSYVSLFDLILLNSIVKNIPSLQGLYFLLQFVSDYVSMCVCVCMYVCVYVCVSLCLSVYLSESKETNVGFWMLLVRILIIIFVQSKFVNRTLLPHTRSTATTTRTTIFIVNHLKNLQSYESIFVLISSINAKR